MNKSKGKKSEFCFSWEKRTHFKNMSMNWYFGSSSSVFSLVSDNISCQKTHVFQVCPHTCICCSLFNYFGQIVGVDFGS